MRNGRVSQRAIDSPPYLTPPIKRKNRARMAAQIKRRNGEDEFRGRSVAGENRLASSGKNRIPPAARAPVPRTQFAP